MSKRVFKDSQSWIYSRRQDLILTAFVFVAAFVLPTISPSKWGILEFSIVAILIDQNHIFTTFCRIYLDPMEFQRRRRLYSLVPLAAAGAAALALSIGKSVFWTTFSILSAFHFIRQQFGWFMITLRKNGALLSEFEIKLNKAIFYGLLILPSLYGMSERSVGFHVLSISPELPTGYATPSLILYFFIVAVASIYEFNKARTTKLLNWAKYNQYLVTIVTSFLCPLFGHGMSPVPLIVTHGITYWYASYVMLHRNPNTLVAPLRTLMLGRWPLVPLFTLISIITFLYWNTVYNTDMSKIIFGQFSYMAPIVFGTFTWSHYLLDAFIWKSSDNPKVREILYTSPSAQV